MASLQEVVIVKAKKFLVGALLIVLAVVISGCVRRSAQTENLEVGSPAPPFTLPDLNGRQVSLSQYKGKVVMLDFWATWCGPCRMSMPVLENLEKEYRDTLVLLAINLQETRDDVSQYMRQQQLHSQVLLDEQASVGEIYGAGSIPMQVLIDKSGIVRYVQLGVVPAKTLRAEIDKLR